MYAHDGAYIASQVSSASRDSQVLGRVESICVDHEIAVILVHVGCLAPIPTVEELGQGFPLDVVNVVHVEPGAVTGQDDGVCLRDEVLSCRGLYALLGLSLGGGAIGGGNSIAAVLLSLAVLVFVAHLDIVLCDR